MFFANPWGLLGLLALPAIVGIHLYRRRFPPLYIAGAHLWGIETRVTEAGRRRDRLPITPSLLLELLAALLLALALADPRRSETEAVEHIVAVLDDSASMQSVPAGKASFRDQAVNELQRRAALTGRDTRLTLVRTGLHPTLIGSRAMSWNDASAALQEWSPSAPRHNFQTAWDEALQLVGEQGKFLFLTDAPTAATDGPPQGMEVLALGEPLGNCGFTAARWTPGGGATADGSAGSVFLRIANYGSAPAQVQVTGTSQGQPVFTQPVSIPASSAAPLELSVPAGLQRLDVTLTHKDDPLAIDNQVTLIEPQSRIVRIAVDLAVDSPESRLVLKALDAQRGWQLADAADADLIIGDATRLPENRRGLWWLGIGPLNRSEAIRRQAVDFIGPYLMERQHPLLDGVSLGGVVWGGVQPTELRLSPLISVDKTIILGRLEGYSTSAWVMNIDLQRSNLSESPDWPILLANLVELRRDALPGLRRWNYRLGESVQLRVPAVSEEDSALVVVTPAGRRRALVRDRDDVVVLPGLEEPGVYEIREDDRLVGQLAANFFDPAESTLLGLSRDHYEPPTTYEPSRISLDNPFSWLIVLAILAILLAELSNWRLVDHGPRRRESAAPV